MHWIVTTSSRDARRMPRRQVLACAVLSLIPGCLSPREDESSGTEVDLSTSTSTTGGMLDATTSTGSDDERDDTSEEGSSSEDSGGNGEGAMCDTFAQDCAAGLKCAYHCVGTDCRPSCRPVTGEGVLGDACTGFGLEAESPDDCGEDTLCWTGEAESGEGVCMPFCTGSPASPMCAEPEQVCAQQTVCLPRCDPFLQDCPDGQGCFDVDFGAFVCWNTADVPSPTGQTCAGNTLCDPGSMCVFASELPTCAGARCCTPYCDLGEPDPCPRIDLSLQCRPYGTNRPDQSHIGVCVLHS